MITAPLRRLETLADFTPNEFERLRAAMTEQRVPAGGALFVAGDLASGDAASAMLLLAGRVVESTQTRSRFDATGHAFQPGDIVGVAALITDHIRFSSARAETDVRVLTFTRAAFRALVDGHDRTAIKLRLVIARQLARDLRRTNTTSTSTDST